MDSSYSRSALRTAQGAAELIEFRFEILSALSTKCNEIGDGRLCVEDSGLFPLDIARALISSQVSA
jgi:hypothetical protein